MEESELYKILDPIETKLGDFFDKVEKINKKDEVTRISGLFFIDMILKWLCGFAIGFTFILAILAIISFIGTLFTLGGASGVKWTIIFWLFSLPAWTFLFLCLKAMYRSILKSYAEYKESYKKNKNNYNQKR